MVETTSTTSAVFVVESVDLDDERTGSREGRILREILRLAAKPSEYWYIRTKRELRKILALFGTSRKRYLHLSCHGDKEALYTTFDRITFQEFGEYSRPYLAERRLFISACDAVNRTFAERIMPGSGCLSLIGPNGPVTFGDAAIAWASFYHLMFRGEETTMLRSEIVRVLQMLSSAFEVPVRYFGRKKDGLSFSDMTIRPQKTTSE